MTGLAPFSKFLNEMDIDERQIKKVDSVFGTDNPVKSSPKLFFICMMASNLVVKAMPGEELLIRSLPSKDLLEFTMPMTEEEKQQFQPERGPKYCWQSARLTDADTTAETGIISHEHEFATHPKMEMNNHRIVACCSTNALQPLAHDIVNNKLLSKGLGTVLTLTTETGGMTTASTDDNALKSILP
ncbi:hypothetical protein FMUND_9897 [Fusarium mundagurra]|uniref:Uncharacterized protein n=1 Tax=Fusarium mundagurra TaxID=1567541 RepID=A0A8H6DBZ2_9HYPO|nr:hypothetical protein FMUND_9897 [Fusarium mundagurra]